MISAILIDDEEPARKTLSAFLTSFCPDVTILAECSNVPEGVLAINKFTPDFIFLDIEMPEYSGFELLKFFKQIDFEIIFVTAYSEYAIKAFEVSAIDYLLKPIQIQSLQAAVEKVKQKKKDFALQQRIDLLKDTLANNEVRKIALPMNDGLLFIDIADIILIEADGSYSHVYLKNGSKILVSKKLRFFEDILSSRVVFFRPHRSHLINLNYLQKYLKGESTILLDNSVRVNLSRDRKVEFESVLKELGLSQ